MKTRLILGRHTEGNAGAGWAEQSLIYRCPYAQIYCKWCKKTKNKPHILHRCTYVQSSKLVCTTLCIDPRLTDSHSGRTKAVTVILTVIPLLCYVDVWVRPEQMRYHVAAVCWQPSHSRHCTPWYTMTRSKLLWGVLLKSEQCYMTVASCLVHVHKSCKDAFIWLPAKADKHILLFLSV